MAAKARQRVERDFSWRSIAERTLAFYADLIGPNATGRL
jgi:glycosyltransferase involved in cell wall biosynthesis